MDNPKQRQMALNSLAAQPGWPVYCERFKEIVKKQIEDTVWELKTTDEDRRTLVAARKLLTETYTPERMLQAMIAVADNEVERAKKN